MTIVFDISISGCGGRGGLGGIALALQSLDPGSSPVFVARGF